MKTPSIGVIKRTLKDGRIEVFQYDKAERKAMGEAKFKKLVSLWESQLVMEIESKENK